MPECMKEEFAGRRGHRPGAAGWAPPAPDLAVFRVAVDVALVLPCVTVNVLAPVSSCERCSMARATC